MECPLCAKSGHMRCSKQSLFDQLVGARQQCQWHPKADRIGRLEVDDQLEFELQKSLTLGGSFFG